MKWYYTVLGGHTHVRVFMNGGKCGDLCFRNEEFDEIAAVPHPLIAFAKDEVPNHYPLSQAECRP